MNKPVIKKWITALRSGDYAKKVGRLVYVEDNKQVGFCCLGVLCNVHAQEHPEFAAKELDPSMYDGHTHTLSFDLKRWAGLGGVNSSIIDDLIHMNDTFNNSFAEIADFLEKKIA